MSIEQAYLQQENEGEELRIRMRRIGDGATCYLTRKRQIGPGVRSETEKIISLEEYMALKSKRDTKREVIEKKRICFVWQNQYFELDIFTRPRALMLLEIELTDLQTEVSLPPFLKIEKEVTGDTKYSNHNLALKPALK